MKAILLCLLVALVAAQSPTPTAPPAPTATPTAPPAPTATPTAPPAPTATPTAPPAPTATPTAAAPTPTATAAAPTPTATAAAPTPTATAAAPTPTATAVPPTPTPTPTPTATPTPTPTSVPVTTYQVRLYNAFQSATQTTAYLCNGTNKVEQASYGQYSGYLQVAIGFTGFTVSSNSSCQGSIPVTGLDVAQGATNWDVYFIGAPVAGPENVAGPATFSQQVITTPLTTAKTPFVSLCHLDAAVAGVKVGLGYIFSNGTVVTADGLNPTPPGGVAYGTCSGYSAQTSTGAHNWVVIYFNGTALALAPNASATGAGSTTWQNGQYYTYTVTGSSPPAFNQISLAISNDSAPPAKSSSGGIPWWYWLILAVIILVVVLLVVGAAAGAWFFYQKRKRQTYETIVDARDDSRWDAPA